MHIITLVESDPRYFKKFEEWINSRNYGCRPYCREIKIYDLNIKKVKLNEFLSDLKNHHYQGNERTKKILYSVIKLVKKVLKLKDIDMNAVKPSGNKCHVPWLYLHPIGYIEDKFHKKDEII